MRNRIDADIRKYCEFGFFSIVPLFAIFIFFLVVSTATCEEQKPEDNCEERSEFSWNPSNKGNSTRLNRFYSLEDLISSEYRNGNYSLATTYVNEYLNLASTYKGNWNYGNAIHDSYRYLGLISYKQGDIDKAAEYLIKSGESTGSPQLDTFGPELDLANLLLKQGKTEEVTIYLKGIRKFWEMDNGAVNAWLEQIEQGKQPELSRHGEHRTSLTLKIINWVTLLWPFAICLIIYFSKRDILSPVKFILSSVPISYIVLFVSSLVSFFLVSPILEAAPVSLTLYILYGFTAIFQFIIPAITALALSKVKILHTQVAG